MSNETEKTKSSGKGGVKVVIVISAVVILALVGVIIWLVLSKDSGEQQERRNVVLTKDNVEEELEKMTSEEAVQPGYYTVTMNNNWHFKKGDAASDDAHVENVEKNTNDVYFDLFLKNDENNAIYKSPIIPRGGTLENIALDTPLEAGTHECLMVYHLIDEDQNTVSTLRVAVTLEIDE